ncbi:MAG: cell envelope integrity protein CreD [Deltaproteobacteria bacterium]|nr:cell envelope integrity protein CreD [Deltaproteobacteria bacterium]
MRSLAISRDALAVDLNLEHRRKGLLWYSTYRVRFVGQYQIGYPTEAPQTVFFQFKSPSQKAIYDDVKLLVDGQEVADLPIRNGILTRELSPAPGQVHFVEVRYATNGMDAWWYDFGLHVKQIKNFSLTMNTNFRQIDFPENSVSPTTKDRTPQGWKLQWAYKNLLSNVKIGMVMPHKLNPGPWVSQVSYAAPISLFLFFFMLLLISTVRQINIHPMNYFFIGAAFFSFHLLLAYMVDHFSVHISFLVASIVSVALVVSYMRLVVGPRFAFCEAAIAQFVYLVVFSYSFFFQGYTGLTITVLEISTLFVLMQMTGRLDWDDVFRRDTGQPQQLKLEGAPPVRG